jgi:hypothetical protein
MLHGSRGTVFSKRVPLAAGGKEITGSCFNKDCQGEARVHTAADGRKNRH